MTTLEEAISSISGEGQPFEVVPRTVNGVTNRVFKNAPATMREFFALARGVDQTFLVYEDEEYSFGDVMARADALGHALVHDYGVRPGDRVGIAMRNYPEWVMAFAAILSVGAVSVSLNAWWTEDELDFAVEDSGLTVLVADAERVERTATTCARRGVRVISVRDATVRPGVERWDDVVRLGDAMPDVEIDTDADATILYTSGTTGRPKGAVSTHFALTQAVMAFASSAAIQSARREGEGPTPAGRNPCFILVVPLFHVTGCVPVMLSCFCWHFKLVMMYRWEPSRALQLIERHQVTAFVGVPTQSWDLMEAPDFDRYDTSSLASIGGGGAPAPPALVERVDRTFTGGRPSLGYGLTETNAYGPGNAGDDYVAHPTSTGKVPTIVLDCQIRDEALSDLGFEATGEIWLKAPTLIRGYWHRPDATAEALVDGWFRTGDLGRITSDGYLYIEDRAKDMVIRAGENVYCTEVESAIYEHPAVYEAAVFGLPHERLGEEVAAVIMVREGSTLTDEEITEFLASRLAGYKIPTRIAFTPAQLPRTATGKLLKREMPARYFPSA